MDEQRRRDDVIDRELSRALRAQGGTTAGGPHLDAEASAAWMERRLDSAASESIEAHLAACADCQALVATLARVTPEPEPSAGWWPALRRPWLVPAAATAAAALVIWVVLPQRASPPQVQERTQARADAPVEPAVPTAPQLRQFVAAESEAAAPPEMQTKQAATPAPRGNAASLPAPSLERESRDAAALVAPASPPPPTTDAPTLDAAAAPAGNARVGAPPPLADTQTARKATVAGEAPASAPPAAPPAERQEQATAGALPRAPNETVMLSASRRAGILSVVAADGRGRWRRSGALIEFAPNATAPFAAAALPVDAATLAAGSSPGGTVSWFVGAAGIVLVTTDGVRFVRATAPAAADLVSVVATDARSAIVMSADGRRFRTTDQGATWTALP